MLGNYIRVTVDPVFEQGVRIPPGELRVINGTAGELGSYGEPAVKAYIFSTTDMRGLMKLRVIAVITEKNTGRVSYAVAAERVVIYEPQIRDMLDDRINGEYDVTCLSEKSCGAVIYRRKSGNLEFLLIKNRRGGNWGFPKGHIERGEDEKTTALREVKEETGLDVRLTEGFRSLSEYHPRGRIFKQVVFFLAEMPEGGQIVPQQAEIDRFIWADYGLAMRTFRFNNDRNVLTQARDWLRSSR